VVSRDRRIDLIDVKTGESVRSLEGRTVMVRDLVYSQDGRLLIAAGGDHTVRLWNSETGKGVLSFPGQQYIVGDLAFSPDGKSLATSSDYGGLIVWDVATSRSRWVSDDFLYGVNVLAWSPDGAVLAAGESGGNDNREVVIRLFDPRAGRALREFPAHLNQVNSLSYSLDGKQLASVGWDARVRIWDPASGKRLHQIRGSDHLRSASFSRDGKTLLVEDRELELYRAEGWLLLHRLEPAEGERRNVQYLRILPDGKTVVTREQWEETTGERPFDRKYRCEVCYRSAENGRLLRSVALAEADRFSRGGCLLSPDGDLYIETDGGRGNFGFRVWDTATGKVMGARSGHTGGVSVWAFSPDGRTFATGSTDTTVLLWDLAEVRVQFWWSELAAKPEGADRAVRRLLESPADSLPWVAGRLRAAAEQEGKAARLVSQLDSDDFETREKASRALADMGNAARLALELAQTDKPSPEVRRRIDELLEKLPARAQGEDSATGRQAFRAITVLEKMGTSDARKVLNELAKAPPESRLGRAAKAALQRLETSKSPERELPR
jgi:WD40 repeat protein